MSRCCSFPEAWRSCLCSRGGSTGAARSARRNSRSLALLLPLRLRALRGALLRGFLRCLLGPDGRDDLARHRVGDPETYAEILEHVAHLVQHPDHLGTGVREMLEGLPLADEAEGLVPGLHQPAAVEALEAFPPSLVRVDELLLEAGLHPEPDCVECGHEFSLSFNPGRSGRWNRASGSAPATRGCRTCAAPPAGRGARPLRRSCAAGA